jgi:hypothetical protein
MITKHHHRFHKALRAASASLCRAALKRPECRARKLRRRQKASKLDAATSGFILPAMHVVNLRRMPLLFVIIFDSNQVPR